MPQETNLNVSPYFDDYYEQDIGGKANNYHKVLFKPGFPVQARELTTLQSILQNQVEQFGTHFFKEGSKVIPGQLNYIKNFNAVQISDEFSGIPVSLYLENLVGLIIKGDTSGIRAKVIKVLTSQESERNTTTLYIDYIDSSSIDSSTKEFLDGEILVAEENISFGNTFILAGQGFASAISASSSATGSAFTISAGVYFIRGNFVSVSDELILLDQYSNNPSYRIGLFVNEQIISSEIDSYLTDNAQGFNNYSAPGADRLKITTTLSKKEVTDYNDVNFIELAVVSNGVLRSIKENTQYNIFANELARRTYDESGDYYINAFSVYPKESLNNKKGNNGIYSENELTEDGQIPSDDKIVYKITPGKAYIKGFEVEAYSTNFITANKAREYKRINDQAVNFVYGSTLTLNRTFGSPKLDITSPSTVSLVNTRVGIASTTVTGKEIGLARVYDFALESGSYNSSNYNLNQWDLTLFDITTYGDMTLNGQTTLSIPTKIKGKSSGATGFLRHAVSSGIGITVYDTSGNFIVGEQLSFNGVDSSITVNNFKNYNISDVQSVYATTGSNITFSGDVIPTPAINIGIATISAGPTISTVTSTTVEFPGILSVGNLIQYTNPNSNLVTYNKVLSVNTKSFTVAGITTVTGICDGALPSSTISVTDLKVLTTKLQNTPDNSNSLFSSLPKNNIKSVDLSDSSLIIRKEFDISITSSQTNTITAGDDEVFLPFDEERYILIRSTGIIEPLSSDKFNFTNGSKNLKIIGLGATNDATCKLVCTLRKSNVKQKVKNKKIVESIVVNKSKYSYSGIGQTSIQDGLTYGNYPYGTRIQDDEICLNYPDIIKIHGIFESNDMNDPTTPSFYVSAMNGPTTTTADLIVGEEFVGSTSGAVGIYLEATSSTRIGFVYLNEIGFQINETVTFRQSGISGKFTAFNAGSKNITSNYTFTNGQKLSYYDYGKIIKKDGVIAPKNKVKVVFARGYYNTSDTGDITTIDSYSNFNYSNEIPTVSTYKTSDIIDYRLIVSSFTPTVNSRSPLEFLGRTFAYSSSKQIITPDESISISFEYYLPRIDRVYLNKNGIFQVKTGVSEENAKLPEEISDSLNVANVYLPAYVYDVNDIKIDAIEHKRYQMSDIFNLENRIKNLEYYTTLSIKESNTSNLTVLDTNGLNRFKSGFFVDNFTENKVQDYTTGVKNSIDENVNQLRPSHHTTSITLDIGTDATLGFNTQVQDYQYPENILGTNIKKTNSLVTLNYTESSLITQPFATRVENVTPYLVKFWQGTIELTPTVDVWVDTVRLAPLTINSTLSSFESLTTALGASTRTLADGTRQGLAPTIWNSWVTTGVVSSSRRGTTTTRTSQTRTGTQQIITEQISNQSLGDRIVSRNLITYMRSRNITFTGKAIKPYTRVYSFFDGINVTNYCVPKLLEISMVSGTFQVGETVVGAILNNQTVDSNYLNIQDQKITFRVANSNHKYGSYNSPTDVYTMNPYDRTVTIPSAYSQSSTILNVDIFGLSNEVQDIFTGYAITGMTLRGLTSGAVATVTNVRLISDQYGTIIGSFFIPNGNLPSTPQFETGKNTFRLTSSDTNSKIEGVVTTSAEDIFYSQGEQDNVQNTTLSVKSAKIETITVQDTQTLTSTVTVPPPRRDPLAQSFIISSEYPNGVFVTKLDVYFRTKGANHSVICQIREMELGLPTTTILPFSEVELTPDKVNISEFASVATTFTFDAPVYLNTNKEYAIVLLSDSTEYTVWISRMGEVNVTDSTLESGQILVSSQNTLGSLFKSQNGSTWDPSQYEDLKFTLYKANFVNSGSVQFFNPKLPDSYGKLGINPVEITSKKIRVGLGSTLNDTELTSTSLGYTIKQANVTNSANLVGTAGIATGNLSIVNSGIGYTPSSGSYTFNNVPLINVTGTGNGATANISITNGSVPSIGATIYNGGTGYSIGDIVTVSTLGTSTLGQNLQLSVSNITAVNQLILDQVQGEFDTVNKLQYVKSSGITTDLNFNVGGNLLISSQPEVLNSGLSAKVNIKNHGMYSNVNKVELKGIVPDTNTIKLTTALTTSSSTVPVEVTSEFDLFEGLTVSGTNPGYILIGDEIIRYTTVTSGLLSNITRGINGTTVASHPLNSIIKKYELDGVSLLRINTTHTVSDPIDFDYYTINIDTSEKTVNSLLYCANRATTSPKLYFNKTKQAGGSNVISSYNVPFELLTPNVGTIVPTGTVIDSSIRTTSAASLDGSETPFVDQGFQSIILNQKNYFSTPRLVASSVNESNLLTNLPGYKSFTMNFDLLTNDSNISPCIYTDKVSAILTTNRVNSPITDYITDDRSNEFYNDPNAFTYTTTNIGLETPATSIKMLITGYINKYNDIRAFYYIENAPTENKNVIFIPFPGYNNITASGATIDISKNDGTLNKKPTFNDKYQHEPGLDLFTEYEFMVDNLPSFTNYRIKLVMTSTNQAYVPIINDIRVIALA